MSRSHTLTKDHQQQIPAPKVFVTPPLTPLSTDKKAFTQVSRVVTLFKNRELGKDTGESPWVEFQLAKGEYDEIKRQLRRDKDLWGFVEDKIRYDYFEGSRRLVVRMATAVHEFFIRRVENEIYDQLKQIRGESDSAATFAQNIWPGGSTRILFSPSSKSEHCPDASFWHDDAEYPGVIIEVGYSQKRKRLGRLAENYLLDSDNAIQVVVGLDIEYGKPKNGSRKATLSVWRTRQVPVVDGQELRVVQEIEDEAFRDDQGNPTDHPGLQLQLIDFAVEPLTHGVGAREISISTGQLSQYLGAAESRMEKRDRAGGTIAPGVKKRKRSDTPPEAITSDTEAWYARQEEMDTEHAERDDDDYEGP